MKKNCLLDLCRVIALKLKKQGFTLAEALIITVMTGACLLPILGTMQNAQVRTENFDHQSKMQQYARSRLNAEIANAAFDHKSINLEDEYHYIVYFDEDNDQDEAKKLELVKTSINLVDFKNLNQKVIKDHWPEEACRLLGITKSGNGRTPYLKVIHAYKTSVETKDNPALAEFGDDTKSVETPKALLGMVIKTSLLESEDNTYDTNGYLEYTNPSTDPTDPNKIITLKDETTQVPPVTLFSFVNLPTVSDEMIWLADAYNWRLYGIDPVGRTVTIVIDLPQTGKVFVNNSYSIDTDSEHFRPWHIAVHPSLKMLAYQTNKYVFLVNIDRNSLSYKKTVFGTAKGFTRKSKYGGLVFRPDGDCLFIVAKNNSDNSINELLPLKVEYNFTNNILDWSETGSNQTPKLTQLVSNNAKLDTERITGLCAGNDGYLYVAQKDTKNILRFPMYQNQWNKWQGHEFIKTNNNIYSIDISPDGNQIAVVTKYENLSIYDTREGKVLYRDESIKDSSLFKTPFKSVFVSYSESAMDLLEDKSFSVAITNKSSTNNKYFTEYFYGLNQPILLRNVKNSINDKIRGWNIVVSPDNRYVVINDLRKARVYFSKTGFDNSKDEYLADDDRIVSYRKIESFDDDKTEDAEANEGEEDNDNVKEYSTELVASKRDVLAVASDKKVQLYDLNTMSILEDENFETIKSITSLSFNSTGNILTGGYANARRENNSADDSNKGHFILHLNDLFADLSDNGGYRKKLIFDNRVNNLLFALEDTNEAFGNCIWNINNRKGNWVDAYPNEDKPDGPYSRRDFSLSSVWKRYDMIGMPRGGIMVLYGKDDGSSMIEWIGRRNWTQDSEDLKGKYRLFARWVSNKPINKIPEELPTLSSAQFDTSLGNLIVEVSQRFPYGSVVKKMSFEKPHGGSGMITPLILQKVSYNKFKIIDIVESTVTLPIPQSKSTVDLNWQNGGTINENCYMGFWFGDLGDTVSDGKKAGSIPYSTLSTDAGSDYTFYCDSTINGNWATKDDVIIGAEVVLSNNAIYDKLSGTDHLYRRIYGIQFEAEVNGMQFPPSFSKKLAISPDCGTLAVLSGENGGDSFLNLYDFNNHIYGPETQIEGLLVDYRVPLNSRDEDNHTYSDHNWPEETDLNYFGKVQTNCNFSNTANCINSFPLATTKHDSWKNYNDYPANFLIHSSEDVVSGAPNSYNKLDSVHKNKSDANKRFFGYFRPEYNVTKLQTGAEDDFRFFLNNCFLWGRVDSWSAALVIMGREGISSSNPVPDSSVPLVNAPLDFFVNQNDSSLFQYDVASNKGAQFSSLFVSSYSSAFKNFWYAFNDTRNKINLNFNINSPLSAIIEKLSSEFNYINSSETYILKNQPVFMGSFKAKTTGGDVLLDPDSTSMIFSRDRAKPVLYLADNEDLWAFYKHGLIRFYDKSSMNINTNLSLSSDGQKLIMGLRDKSLRIYNISNPDNAVFIDSSNKEVTFDSTGKDVISVGYLTSKNSFSSLIKTIPTVSIPSYLATKPSIAYKSSNVGGDYVDITYELEDITSVSPINHNNVSAVASGGIYIFADNNKIYFYNPLTNKLNLKGEMKKKSPYCPMTVYDDILYVFGCGKGEGESEYANRVQSFNTKTDEALFSLDGSTDPSAPQSYFRANLYYNNHNKNALTIGRDKEEGPNKAQNAFNNEDSVWKSTNSTGWISYEINYDYPFIANAIVLDNKVTMPYNHYPFYRCIGVKHFILWGINYDASGAETAPVKLLEDDMPWYSRKDFYMPTNTTAYKKYKLECQTSHDYTNLPDRKVAVKNLYFYRTGVGLLTPSGGWNVDTTNNYIRNTKNSVNPVRVSCSNSDHLNSLPNLFHDSESNNFTFNVDSSNPLSNAYIKFSFENNKVKLSAIRLCNQHSNHSYLTGFKIYGNKDEGVAPENDSCLTADSSSWELINEFTNLPGTYGYVTYELSPSKSYQYYLFKITSYSGGGGNGQVIINQMQLWEDTVAALMGEDASNDYLTPMVNDNLQEIKAGFGAACSTPYGLLYTGGKESDSSVIKSALLYWSHAVNKYDGKYKQLGIPRTLPEINSPRMQHSMIWHKGKIYVIGGTTKTDDKSGILTDGTSLEYLNYNNKMQWDTVAVSDNTLLNGATIDECRRFNHGCVSFGDEIFVFGGSDTGGKTKTAYAWNPETNVIRKISDMPDSLFPCSAVAFGSKIYVMGMHDSTFKIYEYTP